ncbi:hypothetical protein [Brucella intermedia]|uniref:hypothetical protein n=1 Tax=Brucella intermedia TaxID=94625 RepID=UPI0021C74F89|nr:hypothetical protein [Brucella intermedia]UXO85561.1 hypothetical protein N8I72_14430 [Brucella intermedia]
MATKITIADLFPDNRGMILVARHAVDGSWRHISEVANGVACGCICFGCGRRLIARNRGDIRTHSFAHRAEDKVSDCLSSGETALHLRAKQIISEHRRVTLPATSTIGVDGEQVNVTFERSVELSNVHLEVVTGEVVPDVTATLPDGRRIFIEIANTHLCPPKKVEKLGYMGVEVLEIMVSAYRNTPLDDLDDIILDIAPRKLIHSSEVKAMATLIADECQRRENEKICMSQRLVKVYCDPLIYNHKKAQVLVEGLVQLGLYKFLDIEDDRPSAFIIYRRQWQAVILNRLYEEKSASLKPMYFLKSFATKNWLKKEIAYTKSAESKWIAANVYEHFKSPYEEILAYLTRLRVAGAVYEGQGQRFSLDDDLRSWINKVTEKRTRPEHRGKELKNVFRDIAATMLPEDGRLPNFDLWLQGRAATFRLSVEELLADEGDYFDDLLDQMGTIEKTILDLQACKDVDEPDDLLGLPIENLINRLQLARLEAEDRAEAELIAHRQREAAANAERRKREAENRILKAEEVASFDVDDVAVFMETPLPEQGGMTPRELAEEGPKGMEGIQAVLWRIRNDKTSAEQAEIIRNAALNKLCAQVFSYQSLRSDIASLWLATQCKELGWIKPVDYCKDEKTLALCLEVLAEFAKNEKKLRRR